MESIEQINLIGLNNYFRELNNIYKNNKLPNKIILSGKKGIGKSVLSFHFVNFILSANEENKYDITNNKINNYNRSYSLILNNTHPNFFYIKKKIDKKSIEISKIRELKNFVNKSSFNNNLKIVMIDDSEFLSNESGNSLLKLIEEPNSNVQFILIRDNSKYILETIKSRCIEFNIILEKKYNEEIVDNYFKKKIFYKIPNSFLNNFMTPLNFINLINICNEYEIAINEINPNLFIKYILNKKIYNSKFFNINDIRVFIELLLFKEYKKKKNSTLLDNRLKLLKKLSDTIYFNLDLEPFFIELDLILLNEK